jgi:Ribosomal protein S10p/S20e
MSKYALFLKLCRKVGNAYSDIKMYSFRRFTFSFFICLLTKIVRGFLNKLYLSLNHLRLQFCLVLFSLLNDFFLYSYVMNSSTSLSFFDYYFNSYVSSLCISYWSAVSILSTKYIYQLTYSFSFLNYISLLLFSFFPRNNSMLPKKTKLFTLLRSPHTDKKSREQFKLVTYSSVLLDLFSCNIILQQYFSFFTFFSLFMRIRMYEHICI